jgi:hypothetical protein
MNGRARGQRPVDRAFATRFSGFPIPAGRFNALRNARCGLALPIQRQAHPHLFLFLSLDLAIQPGGAQAIQQSAVAWTRRQT